MSPITRLAGSVALAALAAAGAARAQDAEPARLDDVIVTGSQVNLQPVYPGGQVADGGRVGLFGALDQMDTPYSTTAFTAELARNQQARSVADILQNDPVVRVTKGFGNFQELYVIRGFPISSDDVTYNGLYGVLPRQFVAAELLERVEVFHGASTFLNGAAPGGSGVGGAVNLVPKRAGSEPLNRLTAGFEGESELYLAADLGRRFGAQDEWGARLNLVRRDGESLIDRQERELSVIGLGVDRRVGQARFSADFGYQDHRIDAPRPTVTPNGAVPEPPRADVNFAQPWTFTDERQLFGVARGEVDLPEGVTAWAAFGGRKGEESNVLANPNADPDGAMTAYRFDNNRRDFIFSGDVGLRAELRTGPVGHRLVASASSIQSRSENAYAFSSFLTPFATDLYDPVDVAPPAPDFFVGGDLDDPLTTERIRNSSIAVADMLSFLDDRLSVTLGARWQDIRTRSYDYNTGASISAYDGDALTPAFAVLYRPTARISVYGNYSEALIPGQIAPATSGGQPVSNAGEVLEPFRGEQGEVGIKYDAGRFGGALSAYRTTLASAVIRDGVFSADGEQRNQGVELSVYGEPTEGLRLLGGVAWVDAEIRDSRSDAIGVPDFQLNANVEWDVPSLQGLTLDGRVVHTGEQRVGITTDERLDSWTRLDAGVRYGFVAGGRDVTLRARVENLADENQWVAAGGFPGANYLTLGAPRTFTVSVSADF